MLYTKVSHLLKHPLDSLWDRRLRLQSEEMSLFGVIPRHLSQWLLVGKDSKTLYAVEASSSLLLHELNNLSDISTLKNNNTSFFIIYTF